MLVHLLIQLELYLHLTYSEEADNKEDLPPDETEEQKLAKLELLIDQ